MTFSDTTHVGSSRQTSYLDPWRFGLHRVLEGFAVRVAVQPLSKAAPAKYITIFSK